MNIDPEHPDMEERDRFVLSHAHLVPGLYSTLAHRGYFPVDELKTLRQFGSKLQGHTFRDLEIGVETTGGSLGQGLSLANGFAIAARMRAADGSLPSYHTYCAISDGELNEGSTWEALMFAAKEKLDTLTIILDRNGIQLSDDTANIIPLEPLREKMESFNLNLLEVDGHSHQEILFALSKAKLSKGNCTVVIANTTPGKGVSFMEDKWQWHGKAPNDKEYEQAIAELERVHDS